MQEKPLISVVLATYNGERFLRPQLDSIVGQTYPNLEVIAVDDRSTDGTVAILNAYAEQYPFMRVIVNETNLGYVRNFEKGMSMARGELISLSDQDDIWHLNKLQSLADSLADADVVYADSRLIDDQDQPIGDDFSDVRQLRSFGSCLSFVIGNTVSGHGMLITKALVRRSEPFPLTIPHDHWLCFVATFSQPLRFIPQVMVNYRQHDSNVFGVTHTVNGVKRARIKPDKQARLREARERISLLHAKCPPELAREKRVLGLLKKSYQSFSLPNNWLRMVTFFAYREELLATKKRTTLRKWLFCLKMFATIR